MQTISSKEYESLLKAHQVSYIGATKRSAKIALSYKAGVETYCIYLAPWWLSGRNVCPNGQHCHVDCLNASGHNKADILAHGEEESKINQSRIRKTKWFFESRETFMECVIYEIERAKRHAERHGMMFAVRLNGTSDLSPELFRLNGLNILQMYPEVPFYDYTKVPKRIELQWKYDNYYLVVSYDGFNFDLCKKYLDAGGSVAVVFENDLPTAWHGYKVVNGNKSDARFLDPQGDVANGGFIVGLKFHRPASLYKNGHYQRPNNPFIVMEDDPYCTWAFKD